MFGSEIVILSTKMIVKSNTLGLVECHSLVDTDYQKNQWELNKISTTLNEILADRHMCSI